MLVRMFIRLPSQGKYGIRLRLLHPRPAQQQEDAASLERITQLEEEIRLGHRLLSKTPRAQHARVGDPVVFEEENGWFRRFYDELTAGDTYFIVLPQSITTISCQPTNVGGTAITLTHIRRHWFC